uniref:Uncharacterized protein n=1 Tax=Arundo donax TaxID=35708 RepID=A0A0A8YIB5_ARUDO
MLHLYSTVPLGYMICATGHQGLGAKSVVSLSREWCKMKFKLNYR